MKILKLLGFITTLAAIASGLVCVMLGLLGTEMQRREILAWGCVVVWASMCFREECRNSVLEKRILSLLETKKSL